MKILIVAPWGRPLAEVYAGALRQQGADVLIVTTARHHEVTHDDEGVVLVEGSLLHPRTLGTAVAAIRAARRFDPDVVVAEEFSDPRLLPLLALAPVAVLVHDDAPHDPTEIPPWHRRRVSRAVLGRADLLLTFSAFVAGRVRGHATTPVVVLPLPSELPAALVPPLVEAPGRHDVVVLGRINPYKDLPTTLAAWARHTTGPYYRGDELRIIGDGNEADLALPAHCRWERRRFQFAEVAPVLAAAKASVAHYRSATQSGVQVTSMQCGTAAVVSDAGGLAEYLPPGQAPVPAGDEAALAAAFDRLADPKAAAAAGAVARAHHDDRFTPGHAAGALVSNLDALASGVRLRSGPWGRSRSRSS